MQPLATEPLVVLTSASPIVGELLGENRISVRHSATGYGSGPRRTSAPHTGSTVTREACQTHGQRPLGTRHSNCAQAVRNRFGAKSASSAVSLGLPTRTAASMRSRDDR